MSSFRFCSVAYQLENIPREQLFKQLNRRLIHVRQTIKTMLPHDIKLKLNYKRDGKTYF